MSELERMVEDLDVEMTTWPGVEHCAVDAEDKFGQSS
jgi:hypothetical protein